MSELKAASCFEFEKVLSGKSNKLFCSKSEADKVIAEKNKVIAELKADNADLRDDKKSTDAILDERNAEVAKLQAIIDEREKTIEELKADYKEACDRLQTANLIKDEQLAATRHQKCSAGLVQWLASGDPIQEKINQEENNAF